MSDGSSSSSTMPHGKVAAAAPDAAEDAMRGRQASAALGRGTETTAAATTPSRPPTPGKRERAARDDDSDADSDEDSEPMSAQSSLRVRASFLDSPGTEEKKAKVATDLR